MTILTSRRKHRIRTNYERRKKQAADWWKYTVRKEERPPSASLEIANLHHRRKVRHRRRTLNG